MSIHRETDPKYEEQAMAIFHLLLSSSETWKITDMANLIDPSEDWADPETEKITGLTFDLVTHDKQLNVLRFAHLSVREYLENNHREFSDKSLAHENIAISCIEYLEKTRTFIYSPIEYPGVWWVYHCLQAQHSARLRECLSHFLVKDTAAFHSWTFKAAQEKHHHRFHFWLPDERDGFPAISLRAEGCIDRVICESPSTILMASLLGLVDVVNALVRADVSCVDYQSISGVSPLFLACERGHTEVACILLGSTARDESGVFEDAAICVAIKEGHGLIVHQFLNSGYDPQKRAEMHGGEHLLWLAVDNDREDIVAQLLEAGASPHGEGGRDCADTALYTASIRRADIVALLLQFGADPKTQDGDHGYAIFNAAKYDNLTAAKLLVEHGADVNANDFGNRPYIARVERYEDKRPQPVSCHGSSLQYPRTGSTPLFSAVARNHEKMVSFLLQCGADPVPRFPNDRKIFHEVAKKGTSISRRILALNTDFNILDLHTVVSSIGLARYLLPLLHSFFYGFEQSRIFINTSCTPYDLNGSGLAEVASKKLC